MKNSFKTLIKIIVVLTICIILYFYLRNKFVVEDFLSIVNSISPAELLILVALSVILIFIKSLNWQNILKNGNVEKLKFSYFLNPIFASQSLNLIVPANGGELIRFVYLKNKISLGKCFGSIIFERLIDVTCLILFSIAGLILTKNTFFIFLSLGLLLLVIIALILFFNKKTFSSIKKITFKIIKSNKLNKLFADYEEFAATLNIKNTVKFCVLSFLQWSITLFQSFLMFRFIGENINLSEVLKVPIGILITLIPVSFGGLGTREAGFLFLYNNIFSPESIILFTLIFYLTRYLIPGIAGIPFYFSLKIKKNEITK